MNPTILFIIFAAAFASALILKTEKKIRLFSIVFGALGGAAIATYVLPFLLTNKEAYSSLLWRVDGFSALIALLIAIVYVAAILVSSRYISHELEEKIITLGDFKMYFSLLHLFALCMLLTVLANNILLMWIALEGTTLSSTFLVGLYRRKTSIEAAWKYVIICSTGITLGLIGILLMSHGAHVGGLKNGEIFMFSSLMQNANLLNIEVVRWAFVFLFVGFGAKVGLAPMHTWLPDAHSKAPSPISGIFSGILLNVALYSIIRFKFITDAALGNSDWTNKFFIVFGILSIMLPMLMMLVQTNYKRMLAYSSIEHMGIIVFALALSPVGAMAAIIHMVGHAFTKSALFFGAGEILILWKSTTFSKVRGMLSVAPYTSILFLFGILAIIAVPPSALFMSEYLMFTSAISKYSKTALLIFVALGIIAYAMLRLTMEMIFSKQEEGKIMKKEKWNITHTVMSIQLVAMLVLSFWFTTSNGLSFMEYIVNSAIFIPLN